MTIRDSDPSTADAGHDPGVEVVTTPDDPGGPSGTAPAHAAPEPGVHLWGGAALAMAALRLGTGFVFLWAFLDKAFGWGYATPSENAWIDGGSPTEGFLSGVDVGPLADTFNDIAGKGWADWLFMLGLLGIGLAVMLGIGLRIAAVSGTVMMALMWAAEWPPAKTTGSGTPTGSTDPVVDDHVIYALALIAVAATYAGDHVGLGRWWARVPFVRRFRAILR
jgi:thiosulfate dehydrogenase [quinone] large subunit